MGRADPPQIIAMTMFLMVLLLGFALAAAVALVRGLLAFYQDGEALKGNTPERDLQRGAQQNRMMAQRVLFQALAIAAVVLLGTLAAQG